MKVFGIGLNKTGTTTLGDAGEMLGLSRLGWQKGVSHELLQACFDNEIDRLIEEASKWDLLEDFPWPLVYREMADTFPDALFVLTRRRSVEAWLTSQRQHTQASYGMHKRIYGAHSVEEAPEKYREVYDRHLTSVRAFFEGTGRLLEVCWEEGDGWGELCGFLGEPVPDAPFPHSNPAGSNPPRRRPWLVRKARKLKRRLDAKKRPA